MTKGNNLRILSIIATIFVITVSLIPISLKPKIKSPIGVDKWVHILMYTFLCAIFYFDINKNYKRANNTLYNFILAIISVSLLGIIIEIIQHFLPYRSASLYDIIANLIGAILSIIFIYIYKLFANKKHQ